MYQFMCCRFGSKTASNESSKQTSNKMNENNEYCRITSLVSRYCTVCVLSDNEY